MSLFGRLLIAFYLSFFFPCCRDIKWSWSRWPDVTMEAADAAADEQLFFFFSFCPNHFPFLSLWRLRAMSPSPQLFRIRWFLAHRFEDFSCFTLRSLTKKCFGKCPLSCAPSKNRNDAILFVCDFCLCEFGARINTRDKDVGRHAEWPFWNIFGWNGR